MYIVSHQCPVPDHKLNIIPTLTHQNRHQRRSGREEGREWGRISHPHSFMGHGECRNHLRWSAGRNPGCKPYFFNFIHVKHT